MKLRTLAWRRYSECCGGLRDAAVLPAGGPAPIRLLLGIIFNTPFLLLQMHTLAVCKTLAKQARVGKNSRRRVLRQALHEQAREGARTRRRASAVGFTAGATTLTHSFEA